MLSSSTISAFSDPLAGFQRDHIPHPLRSVWASAPCGVSVISAYATGTGAVLAINARVQVRVQVSEQIAFRQAHRATGHTIGPYLLDCARLAFNLCDRPFPACLEIGTDSSVPPGVGLKTSSAVAVALVSALRSHFQLPLSPADIVQVSTETAKKAHLTQAGSVDDTWAAMMGGVVVADANTLCLIERWPASGDLEVLILIPNQSRPRVHSFDRRALLRPYAAKVERLLNQLISKGDLFATMTQSAFLHARAFGYSKAPLQAALKAGALAVSLSGKGPAVAALARAGTGERILSVWRQWPTGRIIRACPENVGVLAMSSGNGLRQASARLMSVQ